MTNENEYAELLRLARDRGEHVAQPHRVTNIRRDAAGNVTADLHFPKEMLERQEMYRQMAAILGRVIDDPIVSSELVECRNNGELVLCLARALKAVHGREEAIASDRREAERDKEYLEKASKIQRERSVKIMEDTLARAREESRKHAAMEPRFRNHPVFVGLQLDKAAMDQVAESNRKSLERHMEQYKAGSGRLISYKPLAYDRIVFCSEENGGVLPVSPEDAILFDNSQSNVGKVVGDLCGSDKAVHAAIAFGNYPGKLADDADSPGKTEPVCTFCQKCEKSFDQELVQSLATPYRVLAVCPDCFKAHGKDEKK